MCLSHIVSLTLMHPIACRLLTQCPTLRRSGARSGRGGAGGLRGRHGRDQRGVVDEVETGQTTLRMEAVVVGAHTEVRPVSFAVLGLFHGQHHGSGPIPAMSGQCLTKSLLEDPQGSYKHCAVSICVSCIFSPCQQRSPIQSYLPRITYLPAVSDEALGPMMARTNDGRIVECTTSEEKSAWCCRFGWLVDDIVGTDGPNEPQDTVSTCSNTVNMQAHT
jgi:hypothetical protein